MERNCRRGGIAFSNTKFEKSGLFSNRLELIIVFIFKWWRLLLEEYHPKVVHIKGVDNNAVDALSRLDLAAKADDLRI